MKIAVPVWDDHVSPVLDVARRVRLVRADGREVLSQWDEELPSGRWVEALAGRGVDVLICGAVSCELADSLRAHVCDVVHEISGPVDEVVRAFLDGHLDIGGFAMPGCSLQAQGEDGGGGRRRRAGRGEVRRRPATSEEQHDEEIRGLANS